jgi:drug/metabolite transporter (DMT)-like permease
LLGYWIWLDIPNVAFLLGAALIILSGAILVRTERRAPA